jgi:hypothetical protein
MTMRAADLRQTLLEKLDRLSEAQLRAVLALIEQEADETPALTLAEWLEQANAFRAALQAEYSEDYYFDSLSVLDEVRDERLNDLVGERMKHERNHRT